MRELTNKEKKLCRELIDKDKQEHHQLRVGDVLYGLYGFECIYKERLGEKYPDSPFKIRLICLSDKRQEIVNDLNEAISLLLMLKDKGMISFVDSKSDECFGDNTPKVMYLSEEAEHSDAAMMDYFDINTWQLLNSYYYISNSFKDYYRKSFKTIEQRRFEKSIRVASLTLILTAGAFLLSIRSCCQSKAISCPEVSKKEIIQNQPKEMINTSTSDTVQITLPITQSSDSIPNSKTP